MAGHSLGEYTALAAAGVLSVGDAARLVQERGRLMQEACDQRPGGMAAVLGLDRMTIEEIARGTGTYVSNVNTPGQIVISGEHMLVAQALDMCLSRGAKKVIPLRVGGAFHSALMEPARAGLVEAVEKLDFSDPMVPIVGNCTGEPLTKADEVKEELVSQITSCVEWEQTIEYMVGSGVSRFVEIGPGKALSGMVKRIDGSAEAVAVGDVASILKLSMN
jgi:[acyl-carrier-protein] S-malonyltransferase